MTPKRIIEIAESLGFIEGVLMGCRSVELHHAVDAAIDIINVVKDAMHEELSQSITENKP